MTALRFSASGGSLFENVGNRMVERDPYDLRRLSAIWQRDALCAQQEGNQRLARLLANEALQAELALSLWAEQRKAATGRNPFEDAA